jgi:hypothetical protein
LIEIKVKTILKVLLWACVGMIVAGPWGLAVVALVWLLQAANIIKITKD